VTGEGKGDARAVGGSGKVYSGVRWAGARAGALALVERVEAELEQYPTQVTGACGGVTKDWRTDR